MYLNSKEGTISQRGLQGKPTRLGTKRQMSTRWLNTCDATLRVVANMSFPQTTHRLTLPQGIDRPRPTNTILKRGCPIHVAFEGLTE